MSRDEPLQCAGLMMRINIVDFETDYRCDKKLICNSQGERIPIRRAEQMHYATIINNSNDNNT